MARAGQKQSNDVIIAGVGGQGTVLASKLLAQAALLDSRQVRTAETIGMAQRGGSVLGHVRMSFQNTGDLNNQRRATTAVMSPLVTQGTADMLIGFEPAETVRALDYLRDGGAVVTAKRTIAPVSAALSGTTYDGRAEIDYLSRLRLSGRIAKLVIVDGDVTCARLGSPKVLNVVLLGAALALGVIHISEESFDAALSALVKPEFIELNKRALQEGKTWV